MCILGQGGIGWLLTIKLDVGVT